MTSGHKKKSSVPPESDRTAVLPETLDVAAVSRFVEAGHAAAVAGEVLLLDASTIQLITAPGLQWLLILERSQQAAGGGLKLSGMCEDVCHQLRMLGAGERLADWQADKA